MIKKYNNISLAFGIPGLIVQTFGVISQITIISLVGAVLLIVGLGYYAKSKGRHPAWCLLGLLSILGIIILALLQDKSSETGTQDIRPFTKILLVLFILIILALIGIAMMAGN